LYHSGCFQTRFFSHSQRGGYTKDLLDVTIWLIWGVKFGGIIDKCISNGNESDDTSEVKRMKFACDNTEVWDRAEEMIPMFMMKGSAQLSEQHGLLKSTVSFGECCVIKAYKCAWFRIS